MSRDSLLKYRRGTAIQWATANPTLATGEPGFETDTLKFKIGDGSTAWNSLQYVGFSGGNIDPTNFSVATPVGLNVNLNISSQKENRVGVSIKFADVEGGGVTTVNQLTSYSNLSLPQYFYLSDTGAAFEITTTATFLGGVYIKFTLPTSVDMSLVRIFKYSSGTTTDVTVLNSGSPGWGSDYAPDVVNRTIYAYVTSFSEFYLIQKNESSSSSSSSVSATPVPTASATPVPTSTPTASATPVPTSTPTASATPVPTSTPTKTPTPSPTKTPTPSPTPTLNTQSLTGMSIGGWGDPQFYILRSGSTNPANKLAAKFLSRWADNKNSNNELRFLEIETTSSLVQVFYTTGFISGTNRRVIKNIRVVHNNTTSTFNVNNNERTKKIIAGPITVSAIKLGAGSNTYLSFEIKWDTINNLIKFGGAASLFLRRVATIKSGFFQGGSGRTWDGIGYAGQPYGISRSYFETNAFRALEVNQDEFLPPSDYAEVETQLNSISEESTYTTDVTEVDSESVQDLTTIINTSGSISEEVDASESSSSSSSLNPPPTPSASNVPTSTPVPAPSSTPTPDSGSSSSSSAYPYFRLNPDKKQEIKWSF